MPDLLNDRVLGDCPYCGCPPFFPAYLPGGTLLKENAVATVTAPSYRESPDPPFNYILDEAPSFGPQPRGAYLLRYCSGAVHLTDFPVATWLPWAVNSNLHFIQPVGVMSHQYTAASNVATFFRQPIPPQPGLLKWFGEQLRTVPYPSMSIEDEGDPTAPRAATFSYVPAAATNKNDAQRLGSCLEMAFYHAGGEIRISYDAPPGFVKPWPAAISRSTTQSPPYPAFTLYRAQPALYFTRLRTQAIAGGDGRQFTFNITVNNASRGRWYAIPRFSGGGITGEVQRLYVNPQDTGDRTNWPLTMWPPISSVEFTAVCQVPRSDLTMILRLDDGNNSIPIIPIPMRPELHLVSAVRGNFFTSPFGDNSLRLEVKLRNAAVGPTSRNLKLNLIDTDNVAWPAPFTIDVPAMGGLGNNFGFGTVNFGLPLSGALIVTHTLHWGTHIPADKTDFLFKFSLTDGPVDHGTFEQRIQLA